MQLCTKCYEHYKTIILLLWYTRICSQSRDAVAESGGEVGEMTGEALSGAEHIGNT